ncbi:MAG: hypothetical protein AAF694_11155 [Bacteroidota bacterium]
MIRSLFTVFLVSTFSLIFSKEVSSPLLYTPESSLSPLSICDTITYINEGDTLQLVGIVESTEGKSFKIRICSTQRLRFLPKRQILSQNGKPYTYVPVDEETMEGIQQEGAYVMVVQENGNRYLGTIVETRQDTLLLDTKDLGKLTLSNRSIKRISPISSTQYKSGVWLTSHGINTRYFFGTNGFSQEKGTGYYQNTWVLFNQFSYGVTNQLSVGAGLVPLFLFGGTPTPIWGTVKYSLPLPTEKFHFATGVLFGTVPGALEVSEGFGLFFGQATFGSHVSNVNIGMGYGFGGGTFAERPAFSLSTLLKMGRKAAFISENYLFYDGFEYVGVLSGGSRFYLKSVSIDGALVFPALGAGEFFAFPWLGLSIPFGK